MNTKISCRAPFEFWSNILSSAIGCHLARGSSTERLGVAVAEQSIFAESCSECREGGSLRG
jgi:hypothetical protein